MFDNSTIKFLYDNEKEALFHTIALDNSKYAIRNKAIFSIAEYAALRASEVGMLEISDLNLCSREIYFKRLKHSNPNTLRILDSTVFRALTDYLAYRQENKITNTTLFVSQKGNPISRKTLDSMMKKYCHLAGITSEKAHFHTLKHTRAVELANLGLDTKEIQYWLGHKSVKNTEIYFQFTTKQQETLYQKLTLYMDKHKMEEIYYDRN